MLLRSTIIMSLFALVLIKNLNAMGMREVFKWKQIDYHEYGAPQGQRRPPGAVYFPEDEYEMNTSYIPYNNVPMGATRYGNRLFVTVPRRREGIPSTLNYVHVGANIKDKSPKLRAYPDFHTNQLTSQDKRIVSVYRTHVDKFGRMWFIDTGKLEYPDNPVQLQKPSIWVIDLNLDMFLRRFEIPSHIVREGQGLASITVDTDLGSDNTFAYIPDLFNNRLYVYSYKTNKIWSFSHNYFHFDPMAGDLNIGGRFFRWNDGIFSVTLGPKKFNNASRYILFHAMASNNEFMVENRVLQNETNAQRADHGSDFRLLGSRGVNMQSTMHAYDRKTGVVFYAEINRNAVGCYNIRKPFRPANHGLVTQNNNTMIYPSDLTITKDRELWVMTNSMPIFIYSQLNPEDYNFRVWAQKTDKAVENTVCAF